MNEQLATRDYIVRVSNTRPENLAALVCKIENEVYASLEIASNLGVLCEEEFSFIPDAVHQQRKRDAESLRNLSQLYAQAHIGLAQIHKMTGNDPESVLKFTNKVMKAKEKDPQQMLMALTGLTYALYPCKDIYSIDQVSLGSAYGALGILRTVTADNYKNFDYREQALQHVLKVPVIGQLFTDYRDIFDGDLALRTDSHDWNICQNYPEYYKVEAY
jgi:hypothetical protein